ncbi:glutathione S-transferase L3-like [Castanea sativa]|uniref:glutathione S-transferase L3-like n=1 Tax=Castanea sativa TaxID=21020 RepID=UPI003F649895
MISPPKLQLQALGKTRAKVLISVKMAAGSLCEVTVQLPSLEHKNEVKGESLVLIKYIDSHFEGPSLFPQDPDKKEFAEELLSYSDGFTRAVISAFKGDGNEAGAAFDFIETALSKYDDGPFFLGQFSLVDIAYAPFIERYQPLLLAEKKYDTIAGRPKLVAWIKEMDKIDGYKQTKREPKEILEIYKKYFLVFSCFLSTVLTVDYLKSVAYNMI